MELPTTEEVAITTTLAMQQHLITTTKTIRRSIRGVTFIILKMSNIIISRDNKITLRSMIQGRRNRILKFQYPPTIMGHHKDMERRTTIIASLDKITITMEATKKIKTITTHLSHIITVERTTIVDTSNQTIIMAMEAITRWPIHQEEAVVT